ncbi:MAG TPA: metallophosphoesterase [Kofleriaceae bacterium]
MPRTFVMGDPQAPFAKVLEVLDWHRALAGDRIAPDVVLVSIGDHFDYDLKNPHTAAQEGMNLLRWLASHDPAQVTLLLGNHDASRVMEMARLTDEQFEAARKLARSIDETEHRDGDAAAKQRTQTEYIPAFPELPPPGVLGRDYASFTTEQRALVQELLLAGRFHLAKTGELPDGRAALITHAGVTTRELGLIGHEEAEPRAIAEALEAQLRTAVDAVRADWERGVSTPLSLEPLHVPGGNGEEGGGLLYHRPSNPDRPDADKAWSLAVTRPRRFDPRTLPIGVTQIVGHSGHAKCVHELGPWVAEPAKQRKHGGIRTLRVEGERVVYDMGIAPAADGVADLILIDGELRRVPSTEVALLPLARLHED